MRFTCDREQILSAINKAEKAVPAKSTVQVMEGLLIEAEYGKVTLTGNDLSISIKSSFAADVEKEGKIVMNARMFSDIIRKTGGETVTFSVGEKKHTTILSGASVFEITGMETEEFPDVPEFETGEHIQLSCDTFKSMIKQTLFSASKDESRPILTGVLFKCENKQLSMVALDGHRLAIRREQVENLPALPDFVVPFKTLNELLKILEDDETIEIYPAKRFILFVFGDTKLYSRVIEGEYPNFERIIAVENSIKCKSDVRALLNTFERVSPITVVETVKSPVKINLTENEMVIDCTTLAGSVHDEMQIEKIYGENIEIGFNNRYLLDAFSCADTDEVFLEFSSPLSPIVITPVEGDSFVYIILPVRIKN